MFSFSSILCCFFSLTTSSSSFSIRHQPVCRGQRRLQPPVSVQAPGRAVRLPHRPGAHRRHEDLHRSRGLPALLPTHRHSPHLAGDQQQQCGHSADWRQGGLCPRFRRHRQPHLLDRHHAEGGSVPPWMECIDELPRRRKQSFIGY